MVKVDAVLGYLQEAKRELPRGWHLVGAMGCDFTHNFPPPLSAAPIKAYLDDAQGKDFLSVWRAQCLATACQGACAQ
jgi:hypothetical protein